MQANTQEYNGRDIDPVDADIMEPEGLPSYEETLENSIRKLYTLRYPQLISRTVHAISVDTGSVSFVKRIKALSTTKSQYYSMDSRGAVDGLVWNCRRESHGFELVFTRMVDVPMTTLPPAAEQAEQENDSDEIEYAQEEDREDREEDQEGRDVDQILLDSKPVDDNREYVHREHDDELPPPAYEANEPKGSRQVQTIRLTSTYPFPFAYDFVFPDGSQETDHRQQQIQSSGRVLKWSRNPEAKDQQSISPESPWTAFTCVENNTGRVVAEVVHYSKKDSTLGTLIVHGDLSPDLHTFLVVSAIAVVEEYPVRHISYLGNAPDSL